MDRKSKQELSVITVCRNRPADLRATIKSVECQSRRDEIEFIVVDGSDPESILDGSWYRRVDVSIIESDTGIYDAMNKGINRATGKWIVFMNAGDLFADCSTVGLVLSLIESVDADLVVGNAIEEHNSGQIRILRRAREAKHLWKGMIGVHQSMYFRRSALPRGGYDTRYTLGADYALVCRISRTGSIHCIDEPLSLIDGSGISKKKIWKKNTEWLQIMIKDNQQPSIVTLAASIWLFGSAIVLKTSTKGFSILKRLIGQALTIRVGNQNNKGGSLPTSDCINDRSHSR